LAALVPANRAMREADAANEPLAYGQGDADFHNALFEHCGNRYFAESYALMAGRFDALRNFLSGGLRRSHPSPADEHDGIIAAFGACDLARAEAFLSSHILAMSGRFAAALGRGAESPGKEGRGGGAPA